VASTGSADPGPAVARDFVRRTYHRSVTAGNPRVPSRLGCGGLLLLLLGGVGTTMFVAAVPIWSALSEAVLFIGQEEYPIGRVWWLVGPLGIASLAGVYRLMTGHRDWLATAAACGWTALGAGYVVATGQYGMLVLAALLTFLIATGTWADRTGDRERGAATS
jgi:hypothetical protein